MATREDPDNGTRSRTGACIVGGGPAGLLLGLLLAKRGADVVVLEGHETFDREFRGEVLQPSTARLLDQIGLLPYILEQPHLTLIAGKLLVVGRQAGEFDFARIAPDYPYAIWMPQPVFLEALVKKAGPFAGFHCWMGARVSELIGSRSPAVRWLVARVLPLMVRSGLFPALQRRLLFGVPLPPLDPAFSFRR